VVLGKVVFEVLMEMEMAVHFFSSLARYLASIRLPINNSSSPPDTASIVLNHYVHVLVYDGWEVAVRAGSSGLFVNYCYTVK
jgi:hypothetical protein